jgi:outer membrane protein TolC
MKRIFHIPVVILVFAASVLAQQGAGVLSFPEIPASNLPAPASTASGNVFTTTQSPLAGGIPSGDATGGTLPLSLSEAIKRGLEHNLGTLLSTESMKAARGSRLRALSRLLPSVSTGVSELQQQVNLEAFGFQGFPGMQTVVGPFNVFDVRASVSQTVLDFSSLNRYRAENENLRAAQFSTENTRDMVVFVCANLYLQAVASNSRIEATRAQVNTAQALYDLAADQKTAGVVSGIEVLRAQVELQAQQQRLIVAEDQHAKDKLALARAIGLPLGQKFVLTDGMAFVPIVEMSLEETAQRAYRERPDFKSAQARVRAAELDRKATKAQHLPTVDFNADYGVIGRRPWDSHGTFDVATVLRIPIFQGGSVRAGEIQAEAVLRQRQAELEDLRARIYYDIQNAFLDLKAAADRVHVSESASKLAEEQVQQSRDRFGAGVTNNVEVIQAQEALATASENYIASLQAHSAAKLALARAIGISEFAYEQFLRGK